MISILNSLLVLIVLFLSQTSAFAAPSCNDLPEFDLQIKENNSNTIISDLNIKTDTSYQFTVVSDKNLNLYSYKFKNWRIYDSETSEILEEPITEILVRSFSEEGQRVFRAYFDLTCSNSGTDFTATYGADLTGVVTIVDKDIPEPLSLKPTFDAVNGNIGKKLQITFNTSVSMGRSKTLEIRDYNTDALLESISSDSDQVNDSVSNYILITPNYDFIGYRKVYINYEKGFFTKNSKEVAALTDKSWTFNIDASQNGDLSPDSSLAEAVSQSSFEFYTYSTNEEYIAKNIKSTIYVSLNIDDLDAYKLIKEKIKKINFDLDSDGEFDRTLYLYNWDTSMGFNDVFYTEVGPYTLNARIDFIDGTSVNVTPKTGEVQEPIKLTITRPLVLKPSGQSNFKLLVEPDFKDKYKIGSISVYDTENAKSYKEYFKVTAGNFKNGKSGNQYLTIVVKPQNKIPTDLLNVDGYYYLPLRFEMQKPAGGNSYYITTYSTTLKIKAQQ